MGAASSHKAKAKDAAQRSRLNSHASRHDADPESRLSNPGMSRILVVEDEQHIADGLRFNLEAEGHEVRIASDGELALASILDEHQSFDVVVLDVMLPGRDGFAVASALR